MVTHNLEIKLKSGELLKFYDIEDGCWVHDAGSNWVRVYPSGKFDGCVIRDDILQIALDEILYVREVRNPRFDRELMQRQRQEFYDKAVAAHHEAREAEEATRTAKRVGSWRNLWMR